MLSRGKPSKQAAVNVFRFVVNSLACVDPKPCGPRKRVVRLVKLQVSIGRRKQKLFAVDESGGKGDCFCKGTKTLGAAMLVELMKEEGSNGWIFFGFVKKPKGRRRTTKTRDPDD